MDALFSTIGIIGLGNIGASLALAIKDANLCVTLYGTDINEEALRYCQAEEIIDAVVPLEKMAADCDLIILAVPPHCVGEVVELLKPNLQDDTVLTDVASVKLPVLNYLETIADESINFVPGHPIAGGTGSGPEHARTDMFTRKLVMLTPPMGVEIDDPALQIVQAFWNHLDTVIELMPADFHDLVYAYVSHLPHLVAFAASATLATVNGLSDEDGVLSRFTRIGDSHPPLWTDIVLNNQPNVLAALKNYIAMISHIREELGEGKEQQEEMADTEDCGTAARVLFPRIAASCLIATVSMLERQSGQRFARYSGAGFADVASPASEAPDGDMELISKHYAAVNALLLRYEKHLDMLAIAIESNQPKQLTEALHEMRNAHTDLAEKLTTAA
ncbi:MAG: prephenate dehydrogenase/arogenate dehydrogenase family protein [Rickettsiales bacterium]|nr:prephenate dehydrogenase/arogenate dehydrogenase family protein [Rickettsiales bacterium]